MSLLSRLANVFRSGRLDSELDEEIRFHIEERIGDLVAGGIGRREAERFARRHFGNPLLLRETSHEVKAARWLESVLQDIRFGCRMLGRDRTAMGAAVLSLALALGACATAFSLIDALILRPLPVSHAEKLFYLGWPDREMRTPPGVPREHNGFSYPLFQRMRAAAGSRLTLFGANWPVLLKMGQQFGHIPPGRSQKHREATIIRIKLNADGLSRWISHPSERAKNWHHD